MGQESVLYVWEAEISISWSVFVAISVVGYPLLMFKWAWLHRVCMYTCCFQSKAQKRWQCNTTFCEVKGFSKAPLKPEEIGTNRLNCAAIPIRGCRVSAPGYWPLNFIVKFGSSQFGGCTWNLQENCRDEYMLYLLLFTKWHRSSGVARVHQGTPGSSVFLSQIYPHADLSQYSFSLS